MKSLDEVIRDYKSDVLDGRDLSRLVSFIPESRLPEMNITLKPEFVGTHEHKVWNRDLILEQLRKDVAFGFEKALNQRGLSSSMMYQVVSMWNWALDEGLAGFNNYAQYGLPLFKATAVEYGFENPIGDDSGSEHKYSEYA